MPRRGLPPVKSALAARPTLPPTMDLFTLNHFGYTPGLSDRVKVDLWHLACPHIKSDKKCLRKL
jgi:hypothetical protein